MGGNDKWNSLGLVFFLTIIITTIEGVFGPIFMDPRRYPLALWYLAFASVVASKDILRLKGKSQAGFPSLASKDVIRN